MSKLLIDESLNETEIQGYYQFLRTPYFSVGDIGESYRTINHWESLGILKDSRKEKSGWRKFSITDVIWLLTISELRKYGYPLRNISKAQKFLFSVDSKLKVKQSKLESYISLALSKVPMSLLLFEDGTSKVINDKINFEEQEKNSFILINFDFFVRKVLKKKTLNPLYKTKLGMNLLELELVSFIRLNNYDEVKIIFHNGEETLLKHKLANLSELLNVIRNKLYKSIEVKLDSEILLALT